MRLRVVGGLIGTRTIPTQEPSCARLGAGACQQLVQATNNAQIWTACARKGMAHGHVPQEISSWWTVKEIQPQWRREAFLESPVEPKGLRCAMLMETPWGPQTPGGSRNSRNYVMSKVGMPLLTDGMAPRVACTPCLSTSAWRSVSSWLVRYKLRQVAAVVLRMQEGVQPDLDESHLARQHCNIRGLSVRGMRAPSWEYAD
ncbi:hypothetical protein IWZ03DRAFT_27297 [Phyllosticta citriasiana]|uniref:Uncharacterized protein n=1 Tax=Phyllosticta citriasiana TaxID=595635 RepID=A0ABR1L202_9PEZI